LGIASVEGKRKGNKPLRFADVMAGANVRVETWSLGKVKGPGAEMKGFIASAKRKGKGITTENGNCDD